MDRLLRVMMWPAALGPAAVVAYLVWRYGVNVPYWDQWALVDPLVEMGFGRFPWAGVFGLHNEHRMVFPKLLMLGLAWLTGWNVIVELWINVLLAVAHLAMLLALARPILRDASPAVRAWSVFALSAIVFSLAQWENWRWGWQIQWFLAVLAATSAVALATWSLRSSRPWLHVAGAAFAAIVCQYSIASGIAIWVSGAMILVFHPRRRAILSVWLALSAGMILLFVLGYERHPSHPSPLEALNRPVEFLLYLGNYLSGPLGKQAVFGYLVGVALALLASAAIRSLRREPELAIPWIAIGAFAVANAVITAVGRVGMGAGQGFASRYVTVSQLAAIALVPLGVLAYRGWTEGRWSRRRAPLAAGAAAVLSFLVVLTDRTSVPLLAAESRRLAEGRECLLRIDEASDDCISRLYPHPLPMRHWTKQLQVLGWSGFPAHPQQPRGTLLVAGPDGPRLWQLRLASNASGWIDGAILEGEQLIVTGWSGHPERSLGGVHKVVVTAGNPAFAESRFVGEGVIAEPTPGVAQHLRDPTLGSSGWRVRGRIPPAAGWPLRLQAYLILSEGVVMPLDGRVAIGETISLANAGVTRTWRIVSSSGRDGWVDTAKVGKGTLSLTGWADPIPRSGDTAHRILVVLGDSIVGEAKIAGDRQDVAAHFGDPRLRYSGWAFSGEGLPDTGSPPRVRVFLALGEDLLTPLAGATDAK